MSYPSQGRSRWIDLRLAEEHTREPLTVIVQKTCPLVSTLATDELSIMMYKFSRSLAPPLMQQNECLIQKGIRTPFLLARPDCDEQGRREAQEEARGGWAAAQGDGEASEGDNGDDRGSRRGRSATMR